MDVPATAERIWKTRCRIVQHCSRRKMSKRLKTVNDRNWSQHVGHTNPVVRMSREIVPRVQFESQFYVVFFLLIRKYTVRRTRPICRAKYIIARLPAGTC